MVFGCMPAPSTCGWYGLPDRRNYEETNGQKNEKEIMTNQNIASIIEGNILPDDAHREMVSISLNPQRGTTCILCGQDKPHGEASCFPCGRLCPDPDCRGYQAKSRDYPCCSGCRNYFLIPNSDRHRRAGQPPIYVYEMQDRHGRRKMGMTWRLGQRQQERNARYSWIGGPFPNVFSGWKAECSAKEILRSQSEELHRRGQKVFAKTLSHPVSATAQVADVVTIKVSRGVDLAGLSPRQVVPVDRYEVLGPRDGQWRRYQDQQEVVIEDSIEAAQGRWMARAITQTGAAGPVTELVIPLSTAS